MVRSQQEEGTLQRAAVHDSSRCWASLGLNAVPRLMHSRAGFFLHARMKPCITHTFITHACTHEQHMGL